MSRPVRHAPSLLLLGALFATGCFYPAERGRMLEARADKLEANDLELGQSLREQRAKLDEQVLEVGRAMEKLDRATRRTGADTGVQVEQMQSDLSQLRGQLEETVHKLRQLEAALAQLKEAGPGQPPSKPATVADPPPQKPEPERPSDKKGFADLVAQKLATEPEAGRKLADEWLKKWPRDPLAARIHLELGNGFRGEKNWRAALSEYGEIVKSFPKGDWAPDALLHSSDCFAALKMTEEARLALEEILNAYPKSEAAKLARPRLADLKRSKGARKP